MSRPLLSLAALGLALLGPLGTLRSAPGSATAAQQGKQGFERLSSDQRQLAAQARRLEQLFELLERKERDAGHEDRAELLAGARERLAKAGSSQDLVAALQRAAGDLAELRSGEALEEQARLIQDLQGVLDFLLQRQLEQQRQGLLQQLVQRAEDLKEMARKQEELLEATRALQRRGERKASEGGKEKPSAAAKPKSPAEKQATPPPGQGSPSGEEPTPSVPQPTPSPEELAREQQELAERIREQAARERQGGRDAQELERAADSGREAAEELRKQQGNLDQARKDQEKALERLKAAAQRAAADARQEQQDGRAQELLDLIQTAQALLERHQAVLDHLETFAEAHPDRRPGRGERVQLRGWAKEETAIAADADGVRTEVSTGGANALPFLMKLLIEDHLRLSKDLGSPRYRAGEDQVLLGKDIGRQWRRIIEALQTERDRIRKQLDQEGPKGQKQRNPSLVGFAEELQLLKRAQEDLRRRLQGFTRRRELLAQAGEDLDEEDRAELDRLIDRQGQLREVFESILALLEEKGKPEPGPGDGKVPEDF